MSATSPLTSTVLRAEGFSCPSCVAKIEKRVARVDGVSDVKVLFASSRIKIDHDSSVVSVDELVDAVAQAGYVAHPAAI
jgi:copper chaperone CopZ